VKRVRNSTARFRCAFCSTDGPAYDSTHISSHLNYKNFPCILGYPRLPFGIFGCNYLCKICFVFDFILHYVFVLHQCVVARIQPSQSLIDMTCTPEMKATPASAKGF
jgi:hypothetical protein